MLMSLFKRLKKLKITRITVYYFNELHKSLIGLPLKQVRAITRDFDNRLCSPDDLGLGIKLLVEDKKLYYIQNNNNLKSNHSAYSSKKCIYSFRKNQALYAKI